MWLNYNIYLMLALCHLYDIGYAHNVDECSPENKIHRPIPHPVSPMKESPPFMLTSVQENVALILVSAADMHEQKSVI